MLFRGLLIWFAFSMPISSTPYETKPTHGLKTRPIPSTPPAPPSGPRSRQNESHTVILGQGTFRGFADSSGNSVYLGIPFAATTAGNNRWKAPQDVPKSGRRTVVNASSYGPTCPQAISDTLYTRQDEDCLNLNIWAPFEADSAPVFVYMYGGAMVTGSNSNPQLQGNNFARKGVIYVNFNTRESIYAYPNSAELTGLQDSQNFGILDVDKAIQWVYDNIAAFGGDPNHIVFGGHSSGSVQVDHYLWNHPDSFLAGAVQMSANAKSGPAVTPLNEGLDVVAKSVDCPTGKGQLACLKKVDIYAFQSEFFNTTSNTWFSPIVDEKTRYADYESRFAAGNYASHVPLLTGNSNGEGVIFSLVYGAENTEFESWINTFNADVGHVADDDLIAAYNASDFATISLMSGSQYGDARFNCPVDYLIDLRSTQQKTWSYRFFGNYTNIVGAPVTAPTHGTEIPFFLGGNECFDSIKGITAEEQALADFMNDWFVAWIKNPSAGPGWNQVSPKNGTLAKIGIPRNELAIELTSTGDFNARCQSVYSSKLSLYPIVQSIAPLAEGLVGV